MKRMTVAAVAMAVCLVAAADAQAVMVDVDPVAYVGTYRVNNGATVSGPSSVDLAPGTYFVTLGTTVMSFQFSVDASGLVSVANGSATGGLGTLTFHNTTVAVDPGAYTGQHRVAGQPAYVTGPATVVLVPDVGRNNIGFGNVAGFEFALDASGTVSVTTPGAAVGGPGTLTFNTTSVAIDPVDYVGPHRVVGQAAFVTGPATLVLVPGVGRYSLGLGGVAGFEFALDASGTVSVTTAGAAIGGQGTLTFNTLPVTVDPVAYGGTYDVGGQPAGQVTGPQTFVLVRGVSRYGIAIPGPGTGFEFNVDAAGVVSVPNGAGQGSFALLTMANVTLAIDPTTYVGNYQVAGYPAVSGPVERVVVPSARTRVFPTEPHSPNTVELTITASSVSPALATFVVSGVFHDFLFGVVTTPDTDGDGIPDDEDPCPTDPANDDDADGVCAADDNCPTVANSDQSDLDGDFLGDACDPDIDGDGIDNAVDNCVYDSNPSQQDADGDGAGDACDADDDGDGVIDAVDACSQTGAGDVVDATGCSIAQICPCEHPAGGGTWKNHGAYVSCVAHAATDFRDAGLISEAERGAIVSDAAESTCGKKN